MVVNLKNLIRNILANKKSASVVCSALFALSVMDVSADVAPLSVSGNKVLANGQPASIPGVSLFWSTDGWGGDKFWNADVVRWLKNDWGARLIRASMGVSDVGGDTSGGFIEDRDGHMEKVRRVVDAAIANDMYVIIDFHSHDADYFTEDAIYFFTEMAKRYGRTNNVIYEIFNEPEKAGIWADRIKPYAEEVISAIREIDPDNLIVVGTPNWAQDVGDAANDPISGRNIAYTLHFYAGSHGQELRNKAIAAINRGLPLVVTEWGSVNADGDGAVNRAETQKWVDFMKQYGLINAKWSINDKAEGAAALKSGSSVNGGWSASQLTESGALSKSIIKNWNGASGGGSSSSAGAAFSQLIQAEARGAQFGTKTSAANDAGGGSAVTAIESGDWISFYNIPVNIPRSGEYLIEYRVASKTGGSLLLQDGGGKVDVASLSVPNTGGAQVWRTVSHKVQLSQGLKKLSLSGTSGSWNVNWLKITKI